MTTEEKNITPVENEAIEATVLDTSNMVHLAKPLSNGTKTLIFDWDKVTGYTLIRCFKSAKKEDPVMTVPSLSLPYQAAVAAAAAGIKYDDILGLTGPDFMAATLKAQAFLTKSAD